MMYYTIITGGFDSNGRPAPAQIHQPPFKNIDDALTYARQLISNGERYIQITDGHGHSLQAQDLVACLEGRAKADDFLPSREIGLPRP